jgi:hypothetical protein
MTPHRYRLRIVAFIVTLCTCLIPGHAAELGAQPAQTSLGVHASSSLNTFWPRELDIDGKRYAIYQPQINAWRGNRIAGHMAVAVLSSDGPPHYGVTRFTAEADIDKSQDEVHLTQVKVTAAQAPAAPDGGESLREELGALLPGEMTLRLSQLQLSYTAAKQLSNRHAMLVRNTPPKIQVEIDPTVLVLIDGDPVLAPVARHPEWQRVVNSRALILRAKDGDYHINAAGYWYTAQTLSGSWHNESAPRQLLNVAAAVASQVEVDPIQLERPVDPGTAPALMVSSEPAELVLLDGPARFRPVLGTSLQSISNADHPLFILPSDHRYYLLVSGRWFSADSLHGPWRHVPSNQLSPEFAHISVHDPLAGVLMTVAGTLQAKEALIAATIPQTATVSRREAMLNIRYFGESPQFSPVVGTTLHFATNTHTPVIQVTPEEYYALYQAVWFTADSPRGPWRVADAVTPAIYTIPPESPLYYVTYVHIYDATPDTVAVGYTPGYLGVIISPEGTVVYGSGYTYPPAIVGNSWVGFPPTYGYNAAMDTTKGLSFGFAIANGWAAEPYWGPYSELPYSRGVDINRIDVYDTWNHGIVRRSVGYHNWSGQEWATGGAQSHHAAAYAAPAGAQGLTSHDNGSPLYGDDHGHVYRHTAGGWQQYTVSGWQPVQRKTYADSNVTDYLEGQRRARIWSSDRYTARYDEEAVRTPQSPFGDARQEPLSAPCPSAKFHSQRRSETPSACCRPITSPRRDGGH